jgi:Domain of unknown function (DUF4160)
MGGRPDIVGRCKSGIPHRDDRARVRCHRSGATLNVGIRFLVFGGVRSAFLNRALNSAVSPSFSTALPVAYAVANAVSRDRTSGTWWPGASEMSPTVFRDGPFRFFFFSREEERLHIHVHSPDGEAKFWLDPEIELARNHGLTAQDLNRVLQLVIDHEQEIRDAWRSHFGR